MTLQTAPSVYICLLLTLACAITSSGEVLPTSCSDACGGDACVLTCSTNLTDLAFLTTVDSTSRQRYHLNITLNNLPTIETNTFAKPELGQVKTLTMPSNHIQTLEGGAFNCLDTLSTLSLDHNEISEIKNDTFSGLGNLKYLSLDDNNISFIQDGSFYGLSNLEHLGLAHNSLSVLKSKTFEGASKLFLLYLRNNQITTIEPEAFFGLTQLFSLHLENNFISAIAPRTFLGLHSLWTLDVTNNRIESIDKTAFETLTNLNNLDLSNNNLANISKISLNISSLTSLKLTNSSIENLPSNFFTDLINLEELFLSGNKLTQLEKGLFDHFRPIQHFKKLTLDANHLTTISIDTLAEIFPILQNQEENSDYMLDLKDNPWDCKHPAMKEMFAWCQEKKVHIYILCARQKGGLRLRTSG